MGSGQLLPDYYDWSEIFFQHGCFRMDSPFSNSSDSPNDADDCGQASRPTEYLTAVDDALRRLIASTDRNIFRRTYGCMDREYWHYRTAAFPSAMYQEGVWPLALAYGRRFPGNRWYGVERVRELALAGIRFSASTDRRDGSCDDYYPYERALGAAVFSTLAAAEACRLLECRDADILAWLVRRARWIADHDESGRLANHHALAAVALQSIGQWIDDSQWIDQGRQRIEQLLSWQHEEGWFEEYGGADPGYQTLTIECLARYQLRAGEEEAAQLDEPICRAVAFSRCFLHPDGSYGGEYGSRGTSHFYPYGFELLSDRLPEAAELALGHRRALRTGRAAVFADDRMYVHPLASRIEAYLHRCDQPPVAQPPTERSTITHFPAAGLMVRSDERAWTAVSTARGGIVKHFNLCGGDKLPEPFTDCGLIVETTAGRFAVTQMHDRSRKVEISDDRIVIESPFHWVRFETATSLKQSILHLGMITLGRWCRGLVRRLLQRRLITARRPAPIHLRRTIELNPPDVPDSTLRITDEITLTNQKIKIRRLAVATDLQSTYVAAAGSYQDSLLQEWKEVGKDKVIDLNRNQHITLIRNVGL